MAKQPPATPPEDIDNEEDQLRRRLVNRIAIAGVLIVALLGGLAIVDAIYAPQPAPAPQAKLAEVPAEPAATEEKKDEANKESTETAAAEGKGEDKSEQATEQKDKTKTAEAVPEKTESAPITAQAKDAGGAKGAAKPLTQPATPRQASIKPTEPPKLSREEPARELAKTNPPLSHPIHAPASKPLTQAAEPARHYQVQLGVFANLANAEELRAKLELAGIPAHIEARVHVGPFSSKEEAEAAQVKLSAMGINPGILMATKR